MTGAEAIVKEKQDKRKQFSRKLTKPLHFSQLQKVIIFASIAFFLAINFNLFKLLQQRLPISTQAQQIGSNLQIQTINQDKLAVYFNTNEPYRTYALFKNPTRQWELVISPEYTLSHFLILTKPKLKTTIQIKLVSLENQIELTKPIVLNQ